MASVSDWKEKCNIIGGILCDITGVLYESVEGGGRAISGSIDALEKLKSAGIPIRFCTNETQATQSGIAAKLNKVGFNIDPREIFAPAPATVGYMKEHQLRPHLLVHQDVLSEFADVDCCQPNCVVLGDATDQFSYSNLNKTFQLLMSLPKPIIISMGLGRYYKSDGQLLLDVGAYAKALEYAVGVDPVVIGKPAPDFFLQALKDMAISPQQGLMIGDDIVSDVGGSQACGLLGIQVRTGKYRPNDEPHPTVTPDGYVNNFQQFVDIFLENRT